ncbi:hypothetical protein [Streptomyces anthocyanicus]|uniref:hypothetical protein n=1 Tax=Streptomyces anthocyanicus TaxID=68174 RepID=UPI001781A44F|nr:hypothetical protein [Streptomyces anthocyanicus]WTC51264.1 hypothetical protein OG855_27495 [Streptomyces anthocyanicus]GHA34540.1 hypothetical protein GCM10010391_17740 [Streptomyces anthocyanicus]
MSTGVIIALIVIVAVVLVVAAVLALRARGPQHGGSLKRRFGPEYDLAVARHDGDTKAAERELAERVRRHGSLHTRPLEPAERERFEARWAAVQERFVDSPREAVGEADRLLAELAGARGFPDGGQYEEQLTALSVHHAHHVEGYRRVHRVTHTRVDDARDGGARTEEMREALVEARALFEALVRQDRHDHGRQRAGTEADASPAQPARTSHTWSLGKRRPKES